MHLWTKCHLTEDYGDVIYDQPNNETFCKSIESVQYNAALAITGTIKGTSRERLYQELGFESLRDRRWYRRLVYFFNIVSLKSPAYLTSLLPDKQRSYDPIGQFLMVFWAKQRFL